jgi:hypothetical protein
MTEPDFGACEVRFLLPDIRLERSECTARTEPLLYTSYLGDTADLIFRNGAGTLHHARTAYRRQGMPGCPITPIRCRSSLRWREVGIRTRP